MSGNTPSGTKSVRWNAIGLAGKQGIALIVAVILAGILGPGAYGVMTQAQVFISLTALILDQGLSAMLVQRRHLTRSLTKSVAGLNILLSALIACATILCAQPIASFFSTPELADVLKILALGLLIKAVGIVPRTLLVRNLRFRQLAICDITAVILGAAVALISANAGLSYWSLVIQVLVMDAASAVMTIAYNRGPGISFRIDYLRGELGFSARVFLSNLITYTSRNADTILIGRFYTATDVGLYGLAYRVLLTPVQMIGQVVVQVLFPHISRLEGDIEATKNAVTKSVRSLSVIAFPLMAAIAVSAPQTVLLLLGETWAPAVPVVMVLAFTGARQAVTAVNSPLLMAQGRGHILLLFSAFSAIVQVCGIAAGLPFGIIGVAWGYTIAGILLTIPLTVLVKRYSHTSYRSLSRCVLPPAHASVWAIGGYLFLELSPLNGWWQVACGIVFGALLYLGALVLFHRRFFEFFLQDFKAIMGLDSS